MKLNSLHWGHLLGIAAVLFLPLGLYAPKGLAPLFIILSMAFVCLRFFVLKHKNISAIGPAHLAVILALPVLGAVSAIWSLAPLASLKTAGIIGVAFFVGSLMVKLSSTLEEQQRHFLEKSIMTGGFIGYTLLAIEQVSNAGLSHFFQQLVGREIMLRNDYTSIFNQGMSVAVLYLWPFSLVLVRRLPMAVALPVLVVCAGSIFLSEAMVPGFALVIGVVALLLTGFMPRIAPKALIVVVVMGTLLAPMIPGLLPNPLKAEPALSKYSDSMLHRMIIWQTAQKHIAAKPVLGAGLNSTRFLYSKADRITYKVEIPSTHRSWGVFSEPIPLHPHNAILQVWMELGVLGALTLVILLVTILRSLRCLALSHWQTATGFGFFSCALSIEAISYGAWQSWWMSTLWLCSMLVMAVLSGQPDIRARVPVTPSPQ